MQIAAMNLKSFCLLLMSLLLALWSLVPVAAQALPDPSFPVFEISKDTPGRIDIGSRMGMLVDNSRNLTAEQIAATAHNWQTIRRPSPNFGFTQDAYWFRFQINNLEPRELTRFIELPIPFIDDVRLHHYVGTALKTHYALGDEQAFEQRAIRHRNFVMPVNLAPGFNLVYIRLASTGTMEAPFRIWDPVEFHAASNEEYLVQGAVIGMLLIMVAYNLFVFFSTRDLNYIYYIGFVASYLLFHLTLTGYMFAYVWPNAVRWNSFAISTFMASSTLFTCLFTGNFLKLRKFSMPAFYLVRGLMVFSAVLLVLTFVLPYSVTVRIGAAITMPTAAIALGLGYWRWWAGDKFARFYCLAWTAILIGLGVLNASKHGWIPINAWTENASQIGIVLLVLLLSFTLADRINSDRTLRLNAQAAALAHERQARATQQALIQATEDANRELEHRVQSRTTDLNATLEQLKIANDQLQRLSTTDGLTQISNRAYFDTAVATEFRRAERQKSALTLVMFDIDHFKHVNDTYGHLCGDACLRALADLLRPKIQRAGDVFARYGGEEFVVVLTATDLDSALALTEEFRAAIEAMQVVFNGETIRITASFGVVSAVPQAPLTVQDFLAAVDCALYQAKHDGRNCVRPATQPHTLA